MRNHVRLFLFVLLTATVFSGCKLFNPSVMLRTKANYPYATSTDTIPMVYITQPGDIVNFRLFSNQGFKIIDLTSLDEGTRSQFNMTSQNLFTYLIEPDSMINLPIIGRVKIAGMNLTEAELFLEDKYSNYYNDPFVMLQVTNRRITVYPGEGGAAQVIQLTNQYTNILEALALAGGISDGGRAHKVKVVRGNLGKPQIFNLDLSTAEGLAEAKLYYVRPNDVIYVQPSYFAGKQILAATGQVLSIISSGILAYLLVLSIQNGGS